MKAKNLILMVVALASGIGASYLTSTLSDDDPARQKVGSVVAGLPGVVGSLQSPEFNIPGERGLPPGYRTVTVEAPAERIAGAFTFVGLRVNVLWHERITVDQVATMIIAEKALILSEKWLTIRDEDGGARPGQEFTLAVKAEDVPKIECAKQIGKIGLALTKPVDDALGDEELAKRGIAPPGYTAVTFRACVETVCGGLAFLLGPGSHVRLAWRSGPSDKTEVVERAILLAENTEVTRDANGTSMPRLLATVAVKPQDVARIERAKQAGIIHICETGRAPASEQLTVDVAALLREDTSATSERPTGETTVVVHPEMICSASRNLLNSRVNVIHVRGTPAGEFESATLLENVRVVAAETQRESDESTKFRNVVTLAVPTAAVPVLQKANLSGTLRLVQE